MVEKVSRLNLRIPPKEGRKSGTPRLTRAEQELRDRLSLALRHAMPEYANQGAWAQYVARHTELTARRVEAHMACEHRVSGFDLLAYFDFFGPDFERKVRGS